MYKLQNTYQNVTQECFIVHVVYVTVTKKTQSTQHFEEEKSVKWQNVLHLQYIIPQRLIDL